MRALVFESQSRSDSSRKTFIDEIDATSTSVMCRIANRTLFESGRRTRNADDKMSAPVSIGNLAEERTQHFLCDFEVENCSATDWSMDFQAAWLATKKFDRLVAHADDFAIVTIDCNNRWLVEENSFARLIYESVDGAQIYSELVIEKLLNEL